MQRAFMVGMSGVLIFSASAMGDVITVPAGGSIQSAIDQASDGDEIVVAPGVYAEQIDLGGRAVHLRSLSGPALTTIDGSGQAGSVVVCDDGEGPSTRIEGFTITGGTGTYFLDEYHGGGMFIRTSAPTIVDCDFTGNTADSGGGVTVFASSAVIRDCRFFENHATGPTGGGGLAANTAAASVINCVFESNTSMLFGGGMNCLGGSPRVTNCVFIGNDGGMGGGIRSSASSPRITNCTIVGNDAVQGGGIRATSGGAPVITNCILWNNGTESMIDLAGATSTVTHCLVDGGWGGAGNIDGDPGLVDDYRLQMDSPCVDAGDNDAVPDGIETDIDGNDRIANGTVDMGAYEPGRATGCHADIDGNGVVGLPDLLGVLSSWGSCAGCRADITGDGEVAFGDLMAVLSAWGGC